MRFKKDSLDLPQEQTQAIRIVNRSGLPSYESSVQSEVLHIAYYVDSSTGENIILWDDIKAAFPNAVHIRDGTTILSFLKGPNFKK